MLPGASSGPAYPTPMGEARGQPAVTFQEAPGLIASPRQPLVPQGLGTEALEASLALPGVRESHFLLESPLRQAQREPLACFCLFSPRPPGN